MLIKTLDVGGFPASFKAMRLPHRSGDKSDSGFISGYDVDRESRCIWSTDDSHRVYYVGDEDLKLASKLILAGPEHAKFIRGINVWVEITGPWYWFNELDTYTIGRTPLSSTSSMHIDCKGLTGEELQKAKAAIKGDYEYTRIFAVNYQSLRNIYFQRKTHRLLEWHEFCKWIESLPLAKDLITVKAKCTCGKYDGKTIPGDWKYCPCCGKQLFEEDV